MLLRVAQCVESTEAEGPGRRFALWVQGCSLRCPGCCNPEMFSPKRGSLVEVDALSAKIRSTPDIEGLSILGGEPFEQAATLVALITQVKAAGLSVMIYSGYSWAELRAQQSPAVDALLGLTDVLVDGRYAQTQPETRRRWVGSTNQSMHFFTSRYAPCDPRFFEPNTVEMRWIKGQLTVNGWPQGAARVRVS